MLVVPIVVWMFGVFVGDFMLVLFGLVDLLFCLLFTCVCFFVLLG